MTGFNCPTGGKSVAEFGPLVVCLRFSWPYPGHNVALSLGCEMILKVISGPSSHEMREERIWLNSNAFMVHSCMYM